MKPKPNKRGAGNSPVALRFHIERLSRAVPECERSVNSTTAYQILLVILVAGLQACAPLAKNTAPGKIKVASTASPSLTASKALALADASLKNWDDDLQHYPRRKAEYSAARDEWLIFYWREPNRWPGDHFMVYVHDKTGIVRVVGGT